MKFPVVFLICFVTLVQYSDKVESRSVSWSPQNILEALTDKTRELKNIITEKGRSLKQFYVDNVHNKITSYFRGNNSFIDYIGDKKNRITRKFKEYILHAEVESNEVFDSIAPKKQKFDCIEDDPSIHMSTPQLIALHGYYAESHTVLTDDGYILTLHRIPHRNNATDNISPRKTVLLHHGLLGSSADWVIAGAKKGLAYILSDRGYDVWMANVRGNTYSRAHTSRSINSFEFWNFTWHDVSQHDLPAVIDYITIVKGWDVKINYIGHSMGTTVLFALLSTKIEYNKILRAGFALAPVAYMSHIQSPIRILAKYANNIEYLLKLLGANEFLPQNSVLRWLSKHACEINHYEEAICENSFFIFCGYDEKQFNTSLLPIILGHVPAGASTKSLVHYAQEIHSNGRFQQFDYGPEGNLRQYGSVTPPEYPIHKITLPIALFSAENDWLAGDIDVSNLYGKLANPIDHYIVPLKDFNHIDFLWAVDAPRLVYDKLLQLLEHDVSATLYNIDYNNLV